MSPTSKSKTRTYSSFKQYKGKFFPDSKDKLDYGLPPEEFGEKLAEEWAKEYKKVLDEFLKQPKEAPRRTRNRRKTKATA